MSGSGPRRASQPRPAWQFRLVARVVHALVVLLRWRRRVTGLGRIPDGGAVLTWNHHSHIDYVPLGLEIYLRFERPVRIVGMEEALDLRLLGWLVRGAGVIPVDRSDPSSRAAAFDAAVQALRRGHLVMVAPEGRIERSPEVASFRTGAVRMAREAGVPVVPTAGWGTQRAMTPDGSLRWREAWRLAVDVAVGAPMEVTAGDAAAAEEVRRATQRLLDGIVDAHG